MQRTHGISWQVTIDNNLVYANPDGNAVLRIYDKENPEKLVEIGMGSQPNEKFWIAVQTPKEGYVVVHSDLERGWSPLSKTIQFGRIGTAPAQMGGMETQGMNQQ